MLLREILVAQGQSAQTALKLACLWLLNPLAMNICSRGSSDAVLSTLLLGSLLLLEPARSRESISLQRVAAAGALFGLAVHLRVYPIIYAPSFVFHLAYQGGQAIGVAKWLQSCFSTPVLLFAVVSACVFLTISYMCFFLYGDAYLWNSLLYHVGRADNRHNFSMYFYWIYLGYEVRRWAIFS
jgi:phosphatidylinositol glycan class M